MNPFSVYNGLHNLSSKEEVVGGLASSILEVYENGKKMKEEFITSRTASNNQGKFHDPLKRFNVKTFKILTKYAVKCKHIQATTEVNKNILGLLLAFSINKERAIHLPTALTYPLSQIPLSLATGDGKRRVTSKSKLIALFVQKVALKDPKTDNSVKEIKEYTFF